MKILMISYRDSRYDGRFIQLRDSLRRIGDLTVFSIPDCSQKTKNRSGVLQYCAYIKDAISFCKNYGKVDILFVDDRKAIIPSIFAKKINHPDFTVLDCRELYFFNEVKTLSGKIGCLLEKYFIPRVDVVIAANKERAEIMNQVYALKRKALVFENIRKVEYSTTCDVGAIKEKYKLYNKSGILNVISTAGCNISQCTDVLVKNINRVRCNVHLLLVGNCESKDKTIIEKIIKDKDLKNVHILGKVMQDELKYLLSISHVGIVAYSEDGKNNKYCASGKVYEYINEGIPIVTTKNPPLQNLCKNEHIGVSDSQFAEGINSVIENIDYYRKNALRYAKERTVEKNNEQLVCDLKRIIESE